MLSYDDATWRTPCRPGLPVDVELSVETKHFSFESLALLIQ